MLAPLNARDLRKSLPLFSRLAKKLNFRSLRWPSNARLTFFKNKSQKIPKIDYEPYDSAEVVAHYPKQVNYTKIQNMITGLGKSHMTY